LGKFREIWAKLLHTPKNLPAPTPTVCITYNTFVASSVLAYGLPSQEAPKNICDQPIER